MRIVKHTITLLLLIIMQSVAASTPHSLERAVELFDDGRWIDSNLELLKLKNSPNNFSPSQMEAIDYYIAMCAVKMENPLANSYLAQFEQCYPTSSYQNQIHFTRAMHCCAEEDYTQAKELFAKVEPSHLSRSDREKYNIRMGYILFYEPNFQAATPYFKAIDIDSDVYHHALYYLSYIDYIKGDNISARRGFTTLCQSDAYSAVAPYYLLQIDFNDGRYEQVIDDGKKLFPHSTQKRKIEIARAMAEAAFRLEDYENVIAYLEKYRTCGGEFHREENYLNGFSLYRIVRYSDAVGYLRGACGADDELTQNASYHLADCYLRLGDKNSAMESFTMATNDNYNAQLAEDALLNYAKLQYELGDDHFNGPINVLSRYLNKYPSSPRREEAKTLLIAAYYNSQNYDAAYASIKEIRNPDADIRLALQRIALYRGIDSYNAGDYAKAVESFEEVQYVNVSPKYSATARFWQGEIAYVNGDYAGALKSYNSYLVNAPMSDDNYKMSLYNIGYTKLMLGSDEEALGYFKRFVAAEDHQSYFYADAQNRLGDLFYGKRQYSQASKSYKQATKSGLEPQYYADYQIAIIDGISGRYKNKISALNGIITSGRGNYIEDASYELGRSYIAAGDYRNGVEAQERFIKLYPFSDRYSQSLSDLGLAYLNLGDKSKAISYYDKAIKSAPQSAVAKDALQGIREIYINQGDADGYFAYAASVGVKGDLSGIERDSLSFASAQKLYLNNEEGSNISIKALKNYIKDYPQGFYTTDALFYLSDSYLKAKQNSDAIATLTQLSKQGANQYSERIYDRLSTLCYAEELYSQSASSYMELYKITKSSGVKQRAISGYADAVLATKNDSSTLKMASFVLSESNIPDNLKVKVKHAKAKILFGNGNEAEAMTIFKELSEDTTSEQGAEAAYILIQKAFDGGDIDIAEQMVFDLSDSNTPHAYWLAKSFIVLGDIYSFRSDFFQARATYQSIIDGYGSSNDGVVELAQSKINKLP